jgi:hypothetical protein
MYVPEELVPFLQKALDNGRTLEDLLYAQGPLLLQHYRQQRDQKSSPKLTKIRRQTKVPKKMRKTAKMSRKSP